MVSRTPRPDPLEWAAKLHEAAAELRVKASRTPSALKLANRLERYADAILFPSLPRWWSDQGRRPGLAASSLAGDD